MEGCRCFLRDPTLPDQKQSCNVLEALFPNTVVSHSCLLIVVPVVLASPKVTCIFTEKFCGEVLIRQILFIRLFVSINTMAATVWWVKTQLILSSSSCCSKKKKMLPYHLFFPWSTKNRCLAECPSCCFLYNKSIEAVKMTRSTIKVSQK